MATTAKVWRNPSYLQSSTGIFLFFCSCGIWWSFFQRWLNSMGLNGAEVGTIYSINSLATLILMFGYGLMGQSRTQAPSRARHLGDRRTRRPLHCSSCTRR